MLVLTRKKSQMIRIGNDIVVKVIQTGKGSVKIGVDAPRDVRVVRGELEFHDAEPVKPKNRRSQPQSAKSPMPMVLSDGKVKHRFHIISPANAARKLCPRAAKAAAARPY